ncbi:hypothetical protein [Citricoccus sp.]|uniref:hypothetical protein n=1 Tax=Citricoccus sp. TaxID=1978372 RepID=UPI0028BF365B|nr:hypothetical protein [Citricoccus sp.]
MRVVSGVVALVLGLAAIFGAVGLQTIWAPPATLTATTDQSSVDAAPEAPLTVITGGINEVAEDPVDYTLTGDGDYTVMLGQTRDIEAWIGDAAHNTVTGVETEVPDGQDPQVVVEHTEGEATVPDPAGSDLWVDTQEASGTIDQRWSVPSEGDWSLLVATDGTEPAPAEMTVSWTNTLGDSPWIVPLAIIGGLLVLAGLGLLVWAFLILRRKAPGNTGHHHHDGGADGTGKVSPDVRGSSASTTSSSSTTPTADGTGQVSRTHAPRMNTARARLAGLLAGSLALVGVLGVGPATAQGTQSAPASDAPQTPDQEPAGEGDQYPILTDSQLERILGQIESVVAEGDEAQDPDVLTPRVADPQLSMRRANYANVQVSDDVRAAEPVAATPLRSVLAPADPAFPRTVTVVTQGEANTTPQLLVLRQDSARTQYRLVTAASMIPAARLPASDLSNTEVEMVAEDDGSGLVMSPATAVDGLARYLNVPDHSFGDQFVHNSMVDGIHDYQASIEEEAPDARLSLLRESIPGTTTTMRLADGSALVTGLLDARMTIAPREEGATVMVDEVAAALAGEDSTESDSPVEMTYREVVALRIPAEGATGDEAKVSMVALTDELQAVTYE